jgi:hypothetical protein
MNESIISKKERKILLKWICKNKKLFKKNKISPNRYFLTIPKNVSLTLFGEIKNKILEKNNILTKNYMNDFLYNDYVGFISQNGQIHEHIDPSIPGYDHIRYNLFLSVPIKGGLPIYNGKTIEVNVGDYVRCNSSYEYHSCEKVMSRIPRIVISYGILLKKKCIEYF